MKDKLSLYPKKCACKKIIDFSDIDKLESEIMSKFCRAEDKGLIQYYHTIENKDLYIFIEDCFKNQSGFEDIKLYRDYCTSKGEKIFVHPKLRKFNYFISIVDSLWNALQKIHREKYIHSDIAPKNIFINHLRQYKLGDFGCTVKLGSELKGFTRVYLNYENTIKLFHNRKITANYELDYFALGKSILELLILENQIDLSNVLNTKTLATYINDLLRKDRKLDLVFSEVIHDVFKGIYKNKRFYLSKKQDHANKAVHLSNTIIQTGYCSLCCNTGINDNEKNNPASLVRCRCKHEFHRYCFQKLVIDKHQKIFLCPVCQLFIGNTAIEALKSK